MPVLLAAMRSMQQRIQDLLEANNREIKARVEAKRQGVSNVTFREGAAQSLRLPDASFDVVIFSWTL